MKLKIYYQNVRGLKSKTTGFRMKLLQNSYDVILLCETWLNLAILSSELFDDRYIVYRKDRNNNAIDKDDGGGCLIAVKKNLSSKRLKDWELGTDVWVAIDHANGDKTFFNVKYIELRSNFDKYKENYDKLLELFMSSKSSDNFILTGDYNLGGTVSWSFDAVKKVHKASEVSGAIANGLLDLLELCSFNQFNTVRNVNDRTLDLFISNLDSKRVEVSRANDLLVPEDLHHPALTVSSDLSPLKFLVEKRQPKTNFFKANYVQLNRDLLQIDWPSELQNLDVNSAVDKFYEILSPFIASIPKTVPSSRDYPNYYTYELISLIKKKSAVKDKLKRVKCSVERSELMAKFSQMRRDVKEMINKCFTDYVNDCEDKLRSNTKCFFAFTKSLRKTNSLPSSMRFGSEVSEDRQSICDSFARFFDSVYSPDVLEEDEIIYDPFVHQTVERVAVECFSQDQVQEAMKSFNVNKVTSPDCIPMMFFMNLALSLSLPLSILFNKSLLEEKFPSKWKISYVSPIFKDGDKDDISNYRPVCIMSAISKIFERLVFNQLFEQIKSQIHHTQHGFFMKRSTQTNLMEYVSEIAQSIVNGGQVDTIYTDFSKAFDKVNHQILVGKLRRFGLTNMLLSWFKSYLEDRSQFVVVGGTKSIRIVPTSGVPQGSILGPLLFIIFINDLLATLSSGSGFADDLKIFRKINGTFDCNLLQQDLTRIIEWCEKNKMVVNVKKCAVMSTTFSLNKIQYVYKINNEELERVSIKKDLGVIFDDKLSFNEHIDDITRKSYRMLGFIFRSGKYFKSQLSMRLLYNTLVRNRLEYCSTVWSPFYHNAIDQLERVQKKFTRMFYFKFNLGNPRPHYHVRLKNLHMHSLESRRMENDEIMLFKLMHGHVDSSLQRNLVYHQPLRTTRQKDTFYLPTMSTNYQHNSPLFRIQRNHDAYFSTFDLQRGSLVMFKKKIRNFFEL